MALDESVRLAIMQHPGGDPRQIAKDVSSTTGRFVPPSVVLKVRGTPTQNTNVTLAREQASSTLADKLSVADAVADKLLAIFEDGVRPMKERLEAAKELRQYLKLGMDAAGINDANTGTLFVIGDDWRLDGEAGDD